jgi:hypothetical protein
MILSLNKECPQFLQESHRKPLLKSLPIHNDGFRKVKVRKKNINAQFVDVFNSVFADHDDLFQRAIFASSIELPSDEKTEPFYIFPIDGYKFMYAENVISTSDVYREMFDTLIGNLKNEASIEIFSDILRFNYKRDSLVEGIEAGAEIIIYGIPYYYAVRKSLVDDYTKFFYDD